MNPNTTPTSRRNRSRSSDTPQEDPDVGFQAFAQQGYIPQFGIPHQFTYNGLIQHGFTPANYQLPPPAIDLEDDFVPETQPPHTPQSISTQQSIPEQSIPGKGKKKKYENRATRQKWTTKEEVALVSAWVDVSEDPVVGNAQTGDSFWNRISKVFYNLMGREDYRSHHQLNSKFKDLNKRITSFAGIYNNLVNTRSSGMSEADISRLAHDRYRVDVGVPFTHEEAWEVLKKCPKWSTVPMMPTNSSSGSKRTKPSDDDEVERPIGRNKAKKNQRVMLVTC